MPNTIDETVGRSTDCRAHTGQAASSAPQGPACSAAGISVRLRCPYGARTAERVLRAAQITCQRTPWWDSLRRSGASFEFEIWGSSDDAVTEEATRLGAALTRIAERSPGLISDVRVSMLVAQPADHLLGGKGR